MFLTPYYYAESPAKAMQGPLEEEPWIERLKNGTLPVEELIELELHRAKSKFPEWPTDPIHAFAIVAEEFGEAAKEVLQLTYEPTKSTVERIRTETIQLAAMCHRFLESLYRYEFKPSAQHSQS